MKRLSTMRVYLGLFNFALLIAIWPEVHAAEAPPANGVVHAALPGNSIYQNSATMTDQNGHSFKLADRRGQPMLVSMFYNSCQFVCPMLIDTLSSTEKELTTDERAHLSMMLITFDPARDDVKTLKSIADKRALDPAHWTLARTDAASVRKIAATLGIQYRLLADGEYNHTTALILLDADGRIVGRTKKIGMVDPDFVKLIRQTLQKTKSVN
ncbi:MAG: SCO family protein [Burkholderiaceae bacterium]